MRTANIIQLLRLPCLPDQDDSDHPVLLVKTDWTKDNQNSFYMDLVDSDGFEITIPTTSDGDTKNPLCLNWGDQISYDKSRLLSKRAIWKGRRFTQRGYSFDGR